MSAGGQGSVTLCTGSCRKAAVRYEYGEHDLSLERVENRPVPLIVGEILADRQSGTLAIVHDGLHRTLFWANGELIMVSSANPDESLASYLMRTNDISLADAQTLAAGEPHEAAARLEDSGLLTSQPRQQRLREWLAALTIPLFNLPEGTAIVTHEEPLDPINRIFLPSTEALVLEAIRSISNGLVIRKSLSDLKREIVAVREPRIAMEFLPLNVLEQKVLSESLETQTIETALRRYPADSAAVAKAIVGLMAVGLVEVVQERRAETGPSFEDTQKDMMLLATIGSDDQRSLQVVRRARELPSIDHYKVLEVPRAASRAQIVARAEELKARYLNAAYPPVVHEYVTAIRNRIEEALNVLTHPLKRPEYDQVLSAAGGGNVDQQIAQQRLTRRAMAEQNYRKADELHVRGDYYGAIILLRQAVDFTPNHDKAWYLLGLCELKNPRWRRKAVESFQKALAINPNDIAILLSMGDLYRVEKMYSRAESCYEDILRINPDHVEAKARLKKLKG